MCSELNCLIFVYGGAILALPRDYNGAISEWLNSPFIDYSGAKCAYFALEIATAQESLFRVVENRVFADRLRNDHLEKSAVMGS